VGSGPAEDSLEKVAAEVRACTRCALHQRRTHAVPGEGSTAPQVLVVGEGPGYEEDRSGRPFVGPAGQYLDKWLQAIDLDRTTTCFIANVVKCRPPGNRDPLPEESQACLPYLLRQLALLRPRAILTVGRIATQNLTGRTEGIGELRGARHEFQGLPLVGTYHPSAVLRNPALRKPVWEDLKRLRSILDHA
jgi:uracil-DNA glycosylase family 4